jgi:vacuolar-type H+-ATPase subunit H
VAVDLNWELTILEIVQGFYLNLLRDVLQEEVTPPRGLEAESLRARDRDVAVLLPAMQRWLKLLDMAITPEMLRLSLTTTIDQDLAESLFRYYARKQSKSDVDRDKTDFVVTFLYRNPRVPGQWTKHGLTMDGVAPVPPFEIALLEILDDADLPELTPEESRILDEFEYLGEEVEQINHFDRLMDGGLIPRARRIKHSFGPAFYHPRALAVIAPYNDRFGRRFAELFTAAAAQVKSYADDVQQRGGSLSSRVDGDITVQQLTQVEAKTILGTEYRRAQEHFHHVSRLKKAVDSKTQARAQAASPAPAAPVAPVAYVAPGAQPAQPAASAPAAPPTAPGFINSAHVHEDNRIRSVEGSIRGWVRAADARCRHIVPMKFGNFVLAPPEADAYCAEFCEEKSFRGDNARVLVRMVAVMARIQAEIEEFKHRQNSNHLWRPHAEALLLLEEAATQAMQSADAVLQLANQRGLGEKAKILSATIDRLRNRVGQAHETLALAGIKPILH